MSETGPSSEASLPLTARQLVYIAGNGSGHATGLTMLRGDALVDRGFSGSPRRWLCLVEGSSTLVLFVFRSSSFICQLRRVCS